MRFLAVNPWIYDFAAYDLWSKPLGLLNIVSHLKNSGHEIHLIDCLDRHHPAIKKISPTACGNQKNFGDGKYYCEEIVKPHILKDIPRTYKRYGLPIDILHKILKKEKDPDAILVTSGMTYWYPACIEVIRMLKERFGDTPVILGGIYANLCYEHAKSNSGADIVYKGSSIHGIFDIISKTLGKKINRTDPIKNIYPSYELYDKLPYITLKTSSGCPYRCTYCGWHLSEKRFVQQDVSYVIGEIEYFYKKYNVRNFAFYDDALLYNADDHLLKILNGIIKKKIKANFHTPNGLHNRFLTKKLAYLLKKSGFVRPRLALETSSKKRQMETGKKTTNKEFKNAIQHLKSAGYGPGEIGVYILIGLPGQDINEIKHSVNFVKDMKVRISLEEYSPIPGTPDYKRSGLKPDADPLLHNNSIFPIYQGEYKKFQNIKDLVHCINASIRKI